MATFSLGFLGGYFLANRHADDRSLLAKRCAEDKARKIEPTRLPTWPEKGRWYRVKGMDIVDEPVVRYFVNRLGGKPSTDSTGRHEPMVTVEFPGRGDLVLRRMSDAPRLPSQHGALYAVVAGIQWQSANSFFRMLESHDILRDGGEFSAWPDEDDQQQERG